MTDSPPRAARPAARRMVLALALPLVAACTGGAGGAAGSSATRDDDAPKATAGTGTTGDAAEAHDVASGADEHAATDRVTLTQAALATAGIVVQPVRAETVTAEGGGLEVPGQVDYDPTRVALVSPRTAGRVERLLAVEGDRVGARQTVALINSPAFVTAQSDLQQAARRAVLLTGTADGEGARALVAAARRRLTLLGAGAGAIRRLEAGGEPATLLPIAAPFAGTIVERPAMEGAAIEPGGPLYRIADLSDVDVTAQVPERALPLLRIGQRARVAIAAYPDLQFAGEVERIKAELDPATRTVAAVLHVPNSRRALRPGMFATVRLDVPLGAAVPAPSAGAGVLTIPEAAVVTDGERRFVFVEVGPRSYERREVRVASLAPAGSASATSGRVAVRDGLTPGERVVVAGAFTLKSELAKAAFAEDEH